VLVRHGLDVALISIYNLGLGLVNYGLCLGLGLDTYGLGLGALAVTASLYITE